MKLWRSGIFWSALGFIGAIGNFVFSAMMARRLPPGEFGDYNTALTGFVGMLILPVSMVATALIHYVAHFRGKNDEARLQGLLAGSQKFLLQATVAGSILSVLFVKPLGLFFHYRTTMMLSVLLCILVALWSNFALALCQGMGWFKRLAIIQQIFGVGVRLFFGWALTAYHPTAEMAVTATTLGFLANLALLYWWKDILRHGAVRISPWNLQFLGFVLVTGAYAAGNYFFLSGDALVAKKNFLPDDLGAYQVAARWCINLPGILLPLLQVMFASRSGSKEGHASSDQRILLGLYAAGLACGALIMIGLRSFLAAKLRGHPDPEAASMMIPYTIAMAFVGLGQAIAMWSLASRWFKLAMLYGALGLTYWIALLELGKSPEALLHLMPIGTGTAFAILLVSWLLAQRYQHPVKSAV